MVNCRSLRKFVSLQLRTSGSLTNIACSLQRLRDVTPSGITQSLYLPHVGGEGTEEPPS